MALFWVNIVYKASDRTFWTILVIVSIYSVLADVIADPMSGHRESGKYLIILHRGAGLSEASLDAKFILKVSACQRSIT